MLITGDVHGEFGRLNAFINKKKPNNLIVCGDFAYYFFLDEDNTGKIKPHNTKIYWLPGNHESISKDSEVLTNKGWKSIQKISLKDKIGNFDINTKELFFDYPQKLHTKFADKIIEFESRNFKQKITFNHDVVYKNEKVKAKDLLNKDLNQLDFPLKVNYNNQEEFPLSSNMMKILQWVVADATIVDHAKYQEGSIKIRIQFKLSKQRKIDRLRHLLDQENIKYTFKPCKKSGINKLQPYYIRIYGDYARNIWELLEYKKEFPEYFSNINNNMIDDFLEELSLTDGRLLNNVIEYITTNKKEADIIQEICLKNNYNSVIFKYKQNKDALGKKDRFIIKIYLKNLYSRYKVSSNIIDYNDLVYCVTMPKGTIVTRVDGKLGLTGNCWDEIERLHGRRGESPIEIEKNIFYCPIGSSTNIDGYEIMFVGGADSYDKQYRILGRDWWQQELLNQQDLDYVLQRNVKPDIICSHTCPKSFNVEDTFEYTDKINDPSRIVLDMILKELKPKFWFFGHWHKYRDSIWKNTKWTALNMIPFTKWYVKIDEQI